jgi:hypothetical protein
MSSRRLLSVIPLLSLAAVVGCSGGGVGKITGSVKLDGKPVADADVSLIPKDNPKLGGRTGRTKADGSFEILPSSRSVPELQPGKYVALVKRYVKKDGSVPQGEDAAMYQASGEMRNSLPSNYAEPDKSPLQVELKNGPNSLEPFELKGRSGR